MRLRMLVLALLGAATPACASDPTPTHERGWIGSRFADVERGPESVFIRRDAIVGMPATTKGDAGALVTAVYRDTPVARAGLEPGDLVLAVDGAPVEGALDLRERVESLAPGSHAQISYWRGGATRTAEIVAGRETYESAGRIEIGIPFEWKVDLWPFDNGINVLGLVRVDWDHARNDLDGPVTAYRRQVDPEAETAPAPPQETFEVFVLPFGAGKGKRVLAQETVP